MVLCPHCQSAAAIRTSEQQTRLVRELLLLCSNDACGFRFVGQIVAVRTIQPSYAPHPAISLPLVVRSRPANDDAPIPANDERAPAADVEPMP
ncbi:ogr/Delta-like zinc finger family protein [Sphingomonas phyllosphaerae]|uniref:ogr/Delta-like zinc finger family protein n=1 Tax=Sphingomonas phyllosphaerae TaxID=257003 RepID=UPI000407E991|nr:ogr/Delta-like zinc finger family protein [Sphingomonas phyllosphaerae]